MRYPGRSGAVPVPARFPARRTVQVTLSSSGRQQVRCLSPLWPTPGTDPWVSLLSGANDIFQRVNPITAADNFADGIGDIGAIDRICMIFSCPTCPWALILAGNSAPPCRY